MRNNANISTVVDDLIVEDGLPTTGEVNQGSLSAIEQPKEELPERDRSHKLNNYLTTEQLIDKVKRGSDEERQQAISDLYHEHGEDLSRYAYKLSSDPTLAQDISQETWEKALLSLDTLRNPEAFRSWLFRIARNLWLDERRHNQVLSMEDDKLHQPIDGVNPSKTQDPLVKLIEAESRNRVLEAINQLPERQHQTLYSRYFDDLTFEETAQRMDVSTRTTYYDKDKAFQRLRISLQQETTY